MNYHFWRGVACICVAFRGVLYPRRVQIWRKFCKNLQKNCVLKKKRKQKENKKKINLKTFG